MKSCWTENLFLADLHLIDEAAVQLARQRQQERYLKQIEEERKVGHAYCVSFSVNPGLMSILSTVVQGG